MFTFLSPLQRPQCSSTRGLRTSALVAAFVDCVELCVRGLLRFDVPHATCFGCSSWPPTLRRRRQRGHVPTAVAAGAPVASSSRHVDSHVDSHAPRCNDENLFLKATTRRTSEATDPDFASEETLLAVWVCHMDCNKWHIDHYTNTAKFYQITRTAVQTVPTIVPHLLRRRRCRHRHRGRCRRRRRRRRRPRRPLLYRSRRTHPGTNFHRMKGGTPQ